MTPSFADLKPVWIYLLWIRRTSSNHLGNLLKSKGKLTDELRDKIHATQSKTELEDLFAVQT